METPAGYKPITVALAQQIAEDCDKAVVVIVAWDKTHEMIHTTTFGKSAQEKIWAANLGEKLNAVAGGDNRNANYFEDFRVLDAAISKEFMDAIAKKLDAARKSLKAIAARSATPWVVQEATDGLKMSE